MSSENGPPSNYFQNNAMTSYIQQMTENITETDQSNLKNSLVSSTTSNIIENQWQDISSTSQNVPRINSQNQISSQFNCNQQYYNHISTPHNHSIFGTGNHHYKINNTWNIPPLSCYQRLPNTENVFVNKNQLLDQSIGTQHQSNVLNKRYHINIYQGMCHVFIQILQKYTVKQYVFQKLMDNFALIC